jgi:predicted dehydrogenase
MSHGMVEKRLRIGVLGVGHLGRIHLQQLRELPEWDVVGFYDPHREKCEAMHQEFGFNSFVDGQSLIAACDAVDVVTPTTAHYACVIEALRAGKHVFVEKPLANTLAQGKAMVDQAMVGGLCLQVGHVERFNPAFQAALPYVHGPLFIETHRLAEFNPRGTDVPVVLDLMIHDIDIVLSVVNSEVTDVRASGVSVVSDTPDIANARITFSNGCVANLTASRISLKRMRKARFFQRDAYIAVDMLEGTTEVVRMLPIVGAPDPFALTLDLANGKGKRQIIFDRPKVPAHNAIREELRSFAQAITSGGRPAVDGRSGQRALEVAHAVLEQMELSARAAGGQ